MCHKCLVLDDTTFTRAYFDRVSIFEALGVGIIGYNELANMNGWNRFVTSLVWNQISRLISGVIKIRSSGGSR